VPVTRSPSRATVSSGRTARPPTTMSRFHAIVACTMAEPAGALFVEQHIVFAEPTGWFGGAKLLRSKLPPVVQYAVRTTRQEWAKAGGGLTGDDATKPPSEPRLR